MSKSINSDINELAVQALNVIGHPLSIKNDQLQFIFVNDAFCDLYGKNREAFLGKTYPEIIRSAQAESSREQDKAVLETGTECSVNCEGVNAGENLQLPSEKRIRLTDQTGRHYVFCMIEAPDTHPLQPQTPLLTTKSGSSISRESIHALNNSLNIIRGYSELLLEDLAAEDPSRKDLEAIYQAGQKAVAITSKL